MGLLHVAAEVLPQRAADRAGEEGGAGRTLPECGCRLCITQLICVSDSLELVCYLKVAADGFWGLILF